MVLERPQSLYSSSSVLGKVGRDTLSIGIGSVMGYACRRGRRGGVNVGDFDVASIPKGCGDPDMGEVGVGAP